MNTRKIGTEYESRAAEWLEDIGYEILSRNFRSSYGEIDLIARQGACLVFVEVKYRKNSSSGKPEEAVSLQKQRKISKTADYFRVKYRIGEETPCRFDVIAVENGEIRHYENAFSYAE